MSDILAKGGGTIGGLIVPGCIPDATFLAEIIVLEAAATKIEGRLVTLTFANNYEVTSAAAGATPDGEIIACRKTTQAAGNSYDLSVRLFHFVDQNSVHNSPNAIVTLKYDGTTALQDTAMVDGADYTYVEDGGANGWGACISIDTSAEKADFLF